MLEICKSHNLQFAAGECPKCMREKATGEPEKITEYLSNVYEATMKVLRENKILRTVDQREKVKNIVEKLLKRSVAQSSVNRCCRDIQNTQELYTAEDDRRVKERKHKRFFHGY